MDRVYLLRKSLKIKPLDKCWGDLPLGNQSLDGYRRDTLKRCGWTHLQDIEPQEEISGPALLVADDVFISKRALKAFTRLLPKQSAQTPVAMVLPHSRQTELFKPLQDVPECDDLVRRDFVYIPVTPKLI